MKSQPRCQVSVLGLQETIIFIINKSLLFFHELNYCFGLGVFFKCQNIEKIQPQFPLAQNDIFKWLFSKSQKYFIWNDTKLRELTIFA